jgi:hypothetical protein
VLSEAAIRVGREAAIVAIVPPSERTLEMQQINEPVRRR